MRAFQSQWDMTVSALPYKVQSFRLHLFTLLCLFCLFCIQRLSVYQRASLYHVNIWYHLAPKCLKNASHFVYSSLVIVSSVSYFYSFSCLFHLQLPLNFSRIFLQLICLRAHLPEIYFSNDCLSTCEFHIRLF